MKQVLKAYYQLRKGWLLTCYILIVLAGLAGMVADSSNWHAWEKAFDQQFSAKEYDQIRDYLGTKQASHEAVYDKFEHAYQYLNLIADDPQNIVPIKTGDELTVSAYYKKLPADFADFRTQHLQYFAPKTQWGSRTGFQAVNSKMYYITTGSPHEVNNISLNGAALIGTPLLVILLVFALSLLVDQWKKLPRFVRSRTGNVSHLLGAQAVYWLGLPLVLAVLISLITQVTRIWFIPAAYVQVPWERVMAYTGEWLVYALIAGLAISFIHALVGNPIYQVITFFCGLFSLGLATQVFYDLTGMRLFVNIDYLDLAILTAVLLPVLLVLQSLYSLEQESAYIRLPQLRLAFYLVIVGLAIFDFLVPLAMGQVKGDLIGVILQVAIPLVIIVLFAKLVLKQDLRQLLKR